MAKNREEVMGKDKLEDGISRESRKHLTLHSTAVFTHTEMHFSV